MEGNVRASDVTISNSEIAMLLGQKLPEENKQAGDKVKKESAREAFVRKIKVPTENNKNKKVTGKVLNREEIDNFSGPHERSDDITMLAFENFTIVPYEQKNPDLEL